MPQLNATLSKRDVSLTTGQIAGIIVGIVVVALILIGIFIWRFLAYRKDFGYYTARGRQSSAKEKALAQSRGHIRSTRPRDADAQGFDDKIGLVASNSHQHDLEEGRRPRPIQEDTASIGRTVGEDDIAASKGKMRQQQVDYEVHQGHHANAAPVVHETLRADEHPANEKTMEEKSSVRRGCTTM